MTVVEKIKRCVSLVWDFQEIYGEEDIEDFCHNELNTYPQHDEIMEYFRRIENLEKNNAYAKTIIQDLLSNSDEYARQRAIDFLKEKEPKSRDNRNNYQDKSTPCYYSRKGKNNYQYSSMGIVDPENYDYISARQYHERYEDTE